MTRSLLLLFCLAPILVGAEPAPLVRAHAHNDYEHARPLFDALDRGFGNIEADVWLVEGQLLVAHDAKDISPERTLEKLYLEPLRQRAGQNGGRIFRNGPTIVLLVDVKSEATATYTALHQVLKSYADILTAFRGGRMDANAVTIIVSGNRAAKLIEAESLRYAAIDGRSTDLDSNSPATLVPWISENWQKLFKWKWVGPMPEAEEKALRDFVARAHAQSRKVRFWNTPDRPDAWQRLLDAGVDVIGTDDLAGLAKFLAAETKR